jgi:hypothetical protein
MKKKAHKWIQYVHPAFGKVDWCERCGVYCKTAARRPCEPKPWPTVRLKCIEGLGYALVYIQYLYPRFFRSQLGTVKKLCEEMGRNHNRASPKYWTLFLRRIEDETENLC